MPFRVSHITVLIALVAAYLLGALGAIDRALTDLRFELLRRPASGSLVVVAIDAKSLKELDVWPWPRSYHAALLDRLIEAGARTIAFDVDFSSRREAADDARFAEAIAEAGGRVVLPTFRQRSHEAASNRDMTVSAPLPELREHARLALVNVRVDEGGQVRWYATREALDGARLPSLAAALADRAVGPRVMAIDFAIEPATLPRLSYADVLHGRFDRGAIAGKAVIIGATAVELGDQLPAPVHGVIPGSIIQALAYESIVQGRALVPTSEPVAIVVGLLLAWIITRPSIGASWRRGAAMLAFANGATLGLGLAAQAALPVVPELAFPLLAPLACFVIDQVHQIDLQALLLWRERSLATHRRAMVQCVVEDSFHGILIADATGRIELFNGSAEKILGYAAADMIGQPVSRILPPLPQIDPLYDDAASGSDADRTMVGPFEVETRRQDGARVPLELVVSRSLVRTGGGKGRRAKSILEHRVLIYTFRDITERRRTEEAQRQAMEEAVAANRAKTEFLANMSHELRTPLNAIIGFSEMLRQEMLGPLGHATYRAYCNDIYNSGAHLLEVINDVLDMSKIEAGEMKLHEERVDVAEVAQACTRLIHERAKKAKVSLSLDCATALPALRADARLVKQILLNLLSNSVKFTPEGGSVTVSAVPVDGAVELAVADTGIGIAAENIERALTPFGQVDSRLARKYEGTGLGLPLVNAMANLHGATLRIDSAVGKGTTVVLRFPAARTIFASDTPAATQAA
jgi:PAS domain S-box-containing protein